MSDAKEISPAVAAMLAKANAAKVTTTSQEQEQEAAPSVATQYPRYLAPSAPTAIHFKKADGGRRIFIDGVIQAENDGQQKTLEEMAAVGNLTLAATAKPGKFNSDPFASE